MGGLARGIDESVGSVDAPTGVVDKPGARDKPLAVEGVGALAGFVGKLVGSIGGPAECLGPGPARGANEPSGCVEEPLIMGHVDEPVG